MPPLIFPQQATALALELYLAQAITLRLYSNNHTPQEVDGAASYVEAVGGGYAAVALNSAIWAIAPGSPSVALYGTYIDFVFTGATAPATLYGYYLTNPDDVVVWAEEFDPSDIPFVTALGAILQIRPRIGAANLVYTPPEFP